jgi:hypothetical protein
MMPICLPRSAENFPPPGRRVLLVRGRHGRRFLRMLPEVRGRRPHCAQGVRKTGLLRGFACRQLHLLANCEKPRQGSASFLQKCSTWNDILERPASNRVVALCCVCYQQKSGA